MLWALCQLRLEHPWWPYAGVLPAGAVLVCGHLATPMRQAPSGLWCSPTWD